MSSERLQRLELLIGTEGITKLKQCCVLVLGLGGVGGSAAEALARSGVGKLILVDGDTVSASNINRQTIATTDTIGKDKTAAMKEKILSINPDCEVITHKIFFTKADVEIFTADIDFVVDAIDTISSKLDAVELCQEKGIAFIASLGMANRFDPSKLQVTTLEKTTMDPFAKAVRNAARKRALDLKIPVVFSSEQPFRQNTEVNVEGETRKERIPPASTAFVPPAAGLLCAYWAIRYLLDN